MTYNQMKQRLTHDPCVSNWLKGMIAELDATSRDPVDILADIAILQKLHRRKVDELLAK